MRRAIRVERQLQEVHGQMVFGPPKTRAGVRSVSAPKTLMTILVKHFKTDQVRSSGLAFPSVSGNPMRNPSFRKVWPRTVRAAGFEGFVFHELRHTAAALAIAQGAHPMAIKERLGHASITTTLDRYGGLFPSLDQTVASRLDSVLNESLSPQVRLTLSGPEGLDLEL